MVFDVLVVGAGAAGAFVAHHLKNEGLRVAIADSLSLGEGASGAAGAFLSPGISSLDPIQNLITESFLYAVKFYESFADDLFTQNGLLKIPTDNLQKEQFAQISPDPRLKYQRVDGGFFFPSGGIVDVVPLLERMLNGTTHFWRTKIERIIKCDGFWQCGEIKAKIVVLTNGAQPFPLEIPYINIRPIWGQRVELKAKTKVPHNIHCELSLSATRKTTNTISIGATHKRNVLDFPISDEINIELAAQGRELFDFGDSEVVSAYGGARAASPDYYPIIGQLIDHDKSLKLYPNLINGIKVNQSNLAYFENLYTLNGLGARGFVYGAYGAKLLSDHICNNKEIVENLKPIRMFNRWVKRDAPRNLKESLGLKN